MGISSILYWSREGSAARLQPSFPLVCSAIGCGADQQCTNWQQNLLCVRIRPCIVRLVFKMFFRDLRQQEATTYTVAKWQEGAARKAALRVWSSVAVGLGLGL
jgi:hypothetical protein